MPIYEYECSRCHRRLEKIQSFRDEPLKECPACGGPLERLISPPAIQFKGSGWYVTDYARGSNAAKPANDKPAAASGSEVAPAAPGAASNTSGNGAAPSSAPPADNKKKPG